MRSHPNHRALLAACLLAGLHTGGARARPAQGNAPWTTLLVTAADPASEREAARVHRIGRLNLERTRSLVFVDLDAALVGRKPDGDPLAAARELFHKGQRSYDNLELRQAVGLLRGAVAELNRQLGFLDDLELFTDIHVYLGAALELLGQKEEGREVFRRLLLVNPDAEFDPLVFPPALAAVFKQVRGQVARAGTGSWNVEASPGGAEVWVDGVYRGISPVRVLDLAEGGHLLQLLRRGHRRFGGVFDVVADSEELIRHELEPLAGLERLRQFSGRLVEQLATSDYPPAAHDLLGWMQVDRLFFLAVEKVRDAVVVRAHYFDRKARRRIKAREKSFDPLDDAFPQQLDLFFTSLYMDVDGQAIAATKADAAPAGIPAPPLPEDRGDHDADAGASGGVWTSWWFWTIAGLVVAGGTGLALALTLDPDQGPVDGEVVFRF